MVDRRRQGAARGRHARAILFSRQSARAGRENFPRQDLPQEGPAPGRGRARGPGASIRPRRASSPPNWCGISSPMIRRRPRSNASRMPSSKPAAICRSVCGVDRGARSLGCRHAQIQDAGGLRVLDAAGPHVHADKARRRDSYLRSAWDSASTRRDRRPAGRTPRRAGTDRMPSCIACSGRRGSRAATSKAVDPADLALSSLGAYARPETITALQARLVRSQALALLLMSPEFQRR